MEEQFTTYQTRQHIYRDVRPTRLERYHYAFLWDFFRKNRREIILFIVLLFAQALMEAIALFFINNSVREKILYSFYAIHSSLFITTIFLIITVYLAISFCALKIERQTVLTFINKLRKSWFLLLLNRSPHSITNDQKADFIAKASYHFPLVSLGIDNSALGFIRWILCAIILLILSGTQSLAVFIISFLIIVLSFFIGLIAYGIAKYYVSREVASYSMVLRHMDLTLSEFPFIKTFKQEKEALDHLDTIVGIDTHFRIRRDIWLRYFRKIIYVVLSLTALILFVLHRNHPEIFQQHINDQNFLMGIISLYALRLFYESGRIGLYVPPLFLGLSLSIPQKIAPDIYKTPQKKSWSLLEFRSNKTKLFPEGPYFKKIALQIQKKERSLFIANPYEGKTSLAELFAGQARFNKKTWIVKKDLARIDYPHWSHQERGLFFFSSYFHSDKTTGEIIFGKEKNLITSQDLVALYALLEKYPVFAKALGKKRFVGDSVRIFNANPSLSFMVYALHCLMALPDLIIIDNHWIDQNDPEINELIKILNEALPNSALILFARHDNNIIAYQKKYEIKNGSIQNVIQ